MYQKLASCPRKHGTSFSGTQLDFTPQPGVQCDTWLPGQAPVTNLHMLQSISRCAILSGDYSREFIPLPNYIVDRVVLPIAGGLKHQFL